MSNDSRSTKELFRQWHGGDAEAGQLMAQRFADWFYAIATSRLGEKDGREPCEAACARFGQGVAQQTDARQLVKWAYDIVIEEINKKGKRIADSDEPSLYTSGLKPKELLMRARRHHPAEVKLMEAVYAGKPDSVIEPLAEPFGGMPVGVLKARYTVKKWLRDHVRLPQEVAPEEPVRDRAPLPLYESARMASPAEEANFEQWMLTDLDLCRDIAEFAAFAIALRGGLPSDAPVVAAPAPTPQKAPTKPAPAAAKASDADDDLPSFGPSKTGMVLVAIGIGAFVFLGILLVLVFNAL